ncbi:hypothetical protein CCAX7_47660 [Capsulimonas corticalis]|uniref:Uncharacterized protein n=1 Tax=Capsulimonas corticalis TaxID=2219043 RepID=A0A402CQA8_9BACT|nr:RICIN domain-containing protein [Capsulimonas corticalis]BDI32715.1 hypothetical protein CCAX7_47660 [Capsulimonas corticalis]
MNFSKLKVFAAIVAAAVLPNAGNAATFNVKNAPYNAVGNGVANDFPAINAALQAAIAAGPGSQVYIPAGTYLLASGQQLSIHNANGITVYGDSTTKLVNANHGDNNAFFSVWDSNNITLNQMIFDTTPFRFTQGVVNSISGTSSVNVTLDSGYPTLTDPDVGSTSSEVFFYTDSSSLCYDRTCGGNFASATNTSGSNWTINMTGATLPSTIVGKKFVVWAHNGGGWPFNFTHCTGTCTASNLTDYGGGAGSVGGFWNNSAALNLTNITAGPPPGSGRLCGPAGGYLGEGNRGTITITNNNFSGMEDDEICTGGDFSHILAQTAANKITVENLPNVITYMVGDTVQIWDWVYQAEYVKATCTVTAVSQDGSGNWLLTLNQNVTVPLTGPNPGASQETDGISRCCDLNTAAPVIVKNSSFQGSGRITSMSGPGIDFENNTFYDSSAGLELNAETAWHGGPATSGLTIKNNTFRNIDVQSIDCTVRVSTASNLCNNIDIEGNTFLNGGSHAPFSDGLYSPVNDIRGGGIRLGNASAATIKNNTFTSMWGPPVILQYSNNVQVTGNLFKNTAQQTWSDFNSYGIDMGSVVNIANSQNITLAQNLVSNFGPYGTSLVKTTGTTSGINGATTGIFLTDKALGIFSASDNLALDDAGYGGAGTDLVQWGFGGANNQLWTITPTANGYFKLLSNQNNLPVGVGSSTANGGLLALENANSANEQQWTLVPYDNQTVQLVNLASGLVADVVGQSTTAGAQIDQWVANGGWNQRWYLLAAPTGLAATAHYGQVVLNWTPTVGSTFTVSRGTSASGPFTAIATNVTTNSYADTSVTGGTTYYYVVAATAYAGAGPNSNVVSATPPANANGTYKLINQNSGLALDDPAGWGVGTALDQYGYSGGSNQKWTLTASGAYYTLTCAGNGLAASVNGSAASGAAVLLETLTGGNDQLWTLQVNGAYYKLVNKLSGYVFEVSGSSTSPNAAIDVKASSGAANQNWSFQAP